MTEEELQIKIFSAGGPQEAFNVIRLFFECFSSRMIEIHVDLAAKILEKEKIFDSDALLILEVKIFEKFAEMGAALEACYEKSFAPQKLFVWDWVFLETLIKLGVMGQIFAKKIEIKLENHFKRYCRMKESIKLLDSWFIQPHEETTIRYFHSPVFLILAEAVWLDLAKNSWIRKKKIFQLSQKACGSLLSSLCLPRK